MQQGKPVGAQVVHAAFACCRRMGLDNLWKPDLRGRIEQGISRIAAGQVTKDTVSPSCCPSSTR
jgi:hypothetical protein